MLISEVDETEIFKICLEYWNSLVSDLYRESPFVATVNPLFIGKSIELPPRRILYNPILSKVGLLISRNFHIQLLSEVQNDKYC